MLRKGNAYVMAAIAAVIIGGLLIWGAKTANQLAATTGEPQMMVTEPTGMTPTETTAPADTSVESQLQEMDSQLGTAPGLQLSVDSAINDIPIDNGQ
jgi:hypothetical protein